MLVEIRRYRIEPGRLDEFVRFFTDEVHPAMEAAGMRILGTFTAVSEPDVFVYLRAFADEEERDRQYGAFYEGETWLGGMRERALDLEQDYEVLLVRSTPQSGI
jgi:hypothetical protein